jgi:hypothetical protein
MIVCQTKVLLPPEILHSTQYLTGLRRSQHRSCHGHPPRCSNSSPPALSICFLATAQQRFCSAKPMPLSSNLLLYGPPGVCDLDYRTTVPFPQLRLFTIRRGALGWLAFAVAFGECRASPRRNSSLCSLGRACDAISCFDLNGPAVTACCQWGRPVPCLSTKHPLMAVANFATLLSLHSNAVATRGRPRVTTCTLPLRQYTPSFEIALQRPC